MRVARRSRLPFAARCVFPATAALGAGCGQPAAAPDVPPPAIATPRLADVQRLGLIGTLGEKLGTIITVRGRVVDGSKLSEKGAAGETFLDVEAVGDRPLVPAVRVQVVAHPFALQQFTPPTDGTAVTLTGYETGGFDGIVAGETRYTGLYQGRGFYFDTVFIALTAAKSG